MPKDQEVSVPVHELKKILQELVILRDNSECRRVEAQARQSYARYSDAAIIAARVNAYSAALDIVRTRLNSYLGNQTVDLFHKE